MVGFLPIQVFSRRFLRAGTGGALTTSQNTAKPLLSCMGIVPDRIIPPLVLSREGKKNKELRCLCFDGSIWHPDHIICSEWDNPTWLGRWMLLEWQHRRYGGMEGLAPFSVRDDFEKNPESTLESTWKSGNLCQLPPGAPVSLAPAARVADYLLHTLIVGPLTLPIAREHVMQWPEKVRWVVGRMGTCRPVSNITTSEIPIFILGSMRNPWDLKVLGGN